MLWSGRFEGKMTPAFKEMNRSLPVDIRLLPYEVKQNLAYAECLAKIGILSEKELAAINKGLKQILSEFENGRYFPLPDDEDIHSLVEIRLTEIIGEVGKKIHTGRSRNEEVITEVKMYLHDAISAARKNINLLVGVLADMASKNKDVIMPGYTHMQHAQPVLFAHYLCSFAFSLLDDDKRLERILDGQLSECPMGSGAIAGSAFPIDRSAIAKALGFKRPTPNSISAISQRDDLLEVSSALSIIMIHLSRYAEDFIMWSTPEFGFIELSEGVSTGSSMMPQKKNPDALELIRGKAARALGNMQTLFTLMKGLPLTYSRDMQEDKRPLFDICDETASCLIVFKDIVEGMKINKAAMSAALEGLLYTTDMADYLVKKGMPFREAHAVIGGIVRETASRKIDLSDFKLEELKKISQLFEADIFDQLSAERSIKNREIPGGTGPASVEIQIKKITKVVSENSSSFRHC